MFSVNEFSFTIKPAKPQFCQNIVSCVQRTSTHSSLLQVSGVGFIWGESKLTDSTAGKIRKRNTNDGCY